MMYICEKCGKSFTGKRSLGGHVSSHNRGEQYKEKRKKNKEEILKKHDCKFCHKEFLTGQSLGAHTIGCKNNPKYDQFRQNVSVNKKGKSLSYEHIQKLKQKCGGYRERSGRGKKGWYDSIFNGKVFLHSSWELKYAEFLDERGIKWKRNTERFTYLFNDVYHYYVPDFYLLDEDTYVEVKGFKTDKDDAKWKNFPFKLIILYGEDLIKLGVKIDR